MQHIETLIKCGASETTYFYYSQKLHIHLFIKSLARKEKEQFKDLSLNSTMSNNLTPPKRKEIYKYEAPWTLYGMNWSVRPDKRFRLALGSFVEEYNNKVQIVMLDEDGGEFTPRSTFDHPYPTTKIMWIPDTVIFVISF